MQLDWFFSAMPAEAESLREDAFLPVQIYKGRLLGTPEALYHCVSIHYTPNGGRVPGGERRCTIGKTAQSARVATSRHPTVPVATVWEIHMQARTRRKARMRRI